MKTPPKISEISEWLRTRNPLGLFGRGRFTIRDIDPKPWSGHFNYLLTVGKKRFVLRFKGPEWGEPTKGIVDEFRTLRAVEKYRVGPRVYYLTRDFFGEPAMLEEYLEGKLLAALSHEAQRRIFPAVARLIARINAIPVRKAVFPFREPMTRYARHKEVWRKRLGVAVRYAKTRTWGMRVRKHLRAAEAMLDQFEERLGRVLKRQKPAFIFESAHVGHCLKTPGGLRFLNWEQVSYGDPSYTLAVFLASIASRRDFPEVKERMLRLYLKENPVPEFRELVEQRLEEREVSNLIWVLWAYAERRDKRPVERATGVARRFRRVEGMLRGMPR